MFWCEHKFIIRYHWFRWRGFHFFLFFFIPSVIVHNTLKVSPLEGYNIHVGTEILSVNLPVKLSCARMRKIRDTVFFNLGLIGYKAHAYVVYFEQLKKKNYLVGFLFTYFLLSFKNTHFSLEKKQTKKKKTIHIKNESVIIEDLWKEG